MGLRKGVAGTQHPDELVENEAQHGDEVERKRVQGDFRHPSHLNAWHNEPRL